MSAIARVLINLKLDRAFDYAIPNHLIGKVNIGSQVEVPFNKGVLAGYVVAMPSHSKFP